MSSVALPGAPPVNLNVVRWIGFQTIVIREYGRIIRIWGQTIVPSVVTATLYFVIFGSLIGRRVGVMGGFDYKQYIAPGLIMMSVITNSYGNVVASFFGAKFGKHVEELLVSPLPNWVIVAGYATGGVVRGLLVGVAVIGGLWWLRRRNSWRETLLLSWIAAPVVFFELWPGKGFQYLLPIVAPVRARYSSR